MDYVLSKVENLNKNVDKFYLELDGGGMVVVDPVCKMKLEEKDVAFKTEFNGKTYYFCGLSDKKKFEKNPEKYVEP